MEHRGKAANPWWTYFQGVWGGTGSMVLEMFRIASSESEVLKLEKASLLNQYCDTRVLAYNIWLDASMWCNFMPEGAQACNLVSI